RSNSSPPAWQSRALVPSSAALPPALRIRRDILRIGPTLFRRDRLHPEEVRSVVLLFPCSYALRTPINIHHSYSFARLVSVSAVSVSGESRARSFPMARDTPFFTVPVEQ